MDRTKALDALRLDIDGLDRELVALFEKRMALADKVAEVKRQWNIAITDPARENTVIEKAVAAADESVRGETALIMRTIIALSKERQRKAIFDEQFILLPPPIPGEREDIFCAYQGVPGAWAEEALLKLYPGAKTLQTDYFEDVFIAVSRKKARYGVLPIENSQTGAIGEVYDLLRKYGCYIVGQTWIPINQCLLAPPGVELSAIREVYSHPEGLNQCRGYLKNRAWDLQTCRNTALAAKIASEDKTGRIAAIGSRRAADIYGLNVLAPDIMDTNLNRTRFVSIAASPEYDSESDIISVTFSTAHRSGALCGALLPLMTSNINLSRIESRPVTGGKYRFFCDLQGNIEDEIAASALRQAAAECDYFEVLGCYQSI